MKRGLSLRVGASALWGSVLLTLPVFQGSALAQPSGSASTPAGSAPPPVSAPAAVYRCPGNPVLYTDAISGKEAREKGCRLLESVPVSVIQAPKPRTPPAGASAGPTGASGSRIDPVDQRSRDTDARRILEAELKREEERLAALKSDYNNGEPERMGNEKNFQKYQDRVADMKAAIARKESDIAALKRELAKQPQ